MRSLRRPARAIALTQKSAPPAILSPSPRPSVMIFQAHHRNAIYARRAYEQAQALGRERPKSRIHLLA